MGRERPGNWSFTMAIGTDSNTLNAPTLLAQPLIVEEHHADVSHAFQLHARDLGQDDQ